MAYGSVNVPGVGGPELESVRTLAQSAKTDASAALDTAKKAETAAGAAQADAAVAKQTAETAAAGVASAQQKADDAATAAAAAAAAAADAQAAANAAKQSSQNAEKAANNAQTAADAALKKITEIASSINTVPTQSGSLTYTGSALTPTWNSFDPNVLTIGGTTSGTNAGNYSATFTPKEGYQWADGTTGPKTVTWTINRATVAIPSQSGSKTYNGSAQTPSWTGYDSNKMTIGGNTSGTNAGTYAATFTPKANYQWPDGGTGAKSVNWTIGKAAGSLSLSASSMTLDVASLTGNIGVTRAGDGTISASSSNTAVATVSVSGTNVVVTAKKAGTATITVNVAAGTNYNAPTSKTCSVTVEMPSTNIADNTPATIQAAAKAGNASSYWKVGDKIAIKVNGSFGGLTYNDTVYAFILGFNHNSSREGNNSIHFQFGKTANGTDIAFVQSYGSTGTGFCMNTSNTNSGGWNGSYMRKTICPAFLNALPTAWQNVIVACTKYSDNTGGGSDTASYVTSTSDKIWLLSEFEVQGTRSYANSAEKNYQLQYDYYKNGNSKVKYQHNSTGTACHWWLRSVYATYTTHFCYVHTSGGAGNDNAYYSRGFAPGFKVA